MRAAIYSRVNTDRQNESSIADQVRVCSEYADRQGGWQVVERFEAKALAAPHSATGRASLSCKRPHSQAVSTWCWLRISHGYRARKVIFPR